MKLVIAGPSRRLAGVLQGEEVTLAERGVYQPHGRSAWQVGELRLAGDRLRFVEPRGIVFDIAPSWIVALAVERKHFILVHKPVMAISYHDPGRPAPEKACFITPSLGQWLVRLGARPRRRRAG